MIFALVKRYMEPENLLELMRFGLVGVGATLVHLGIALLLSQNTDINIFMVNVLAFLCAFGVSFYGHYFWTFKSSAPKLKALVKFFAVALSGLLASTFMIYVLGQYGIEEDVYRLTISILIIPVVTYIVGKLWAFKH